MTKHWISDDDAAALLRGRTPEARPELAPLAESFADLRAAAFETVPQPSAELAARLALPKAAGQPASPEAAPVASHRGRTRQMIAWFTGLGVIAKVLLASTVATAAVVGTGAAGVLPGGAQETFDNVVSAVVSTAVEEEPTSAPTTEPTGEPTTEPTGDAEEGAHPDNFGGAVSELAQDKPGSGYEFGKWVSETARTKHADQPTTDEPADDGTDGTTDDGTTDAGTTDDGTTAPGQSGNNGHGKPDGVGNGNGNGNGKP